jgi:prepilin-type N-terminal cleavage/methylation domain-containing protein
MSRLEALSTDERGFTLIELLIVVAILGNLLAIAVPSYIQFKDRASQRAASSAVRTAIPLAEQYYDEHGSSYTGLDTKVGGVYTSLTTYDPRVDVTTVKVAVGGASYCIDKTVSIKKASATRGAAALSKGKVTEGTNC